MEIRAFIPKDLKLSLNGMSAESVFDNSFLEEFDNSLDV